MFGVYYSSLTESDVEVLKEPMRLAFSLNSQDGKSFNQVGFDFDSDYFLDHYGIQISDTLAYKICLADKPIGAFVLLWNESGQSVLSHLFVDPKFQRRGIGRQVWQFLHSCYPSQSWRVETPSWATWSRQFYEQVCGFELISETNGIAVYEWIA